MHKQSLLVAAFIICSSFTSPDEMENKVIKAAQDNLSFSLSKIPEGKENLYGFESREQFNNCSIGKPYRVITLNNAFYNDVEIVENKNYITEQNEWRVPVMVNGASRLLLTVTAQAEAYSVVDLGGMQLVKELQKRSENFDSADSHYILRIYPLASDFLVKVRSGSLTTSKYIPLTSALTGIESLNNNSRSDFTLFEVLRLIKQELNNRPKN